MQVRDLEQRRGRSRSQRLPEVGRLDRPRSAITFSGVSQASRRPWCMTAIRSARPVTTSMWCSTISTVLPLARRAPSGSPRRAPARPRPLTPAIGSSSRITRGSRGEQHRQLELALVAVRERAGEPRRASRPSPTRSSAQSRPVERLAHRAARRQIRSAPPSRASAASRTFSSTRQQREDARDLERAAEPELRPPVRRLARDVLAVELDPPAVGRWRPESRLNSDVLPAPFGPMMPRNSPSRDLEPDIGDDGARRRCRARGRGSRGS